LTDAATGGGDAANVAPVSPCGMEMSDGFLGDRTTTEAVTVGEEGAAIGATAIAGDTAAAEDVAAEDVAAEPKSRA
jgi:hypothetical protein